MQFPQRFIISGNFVLHSGLISNTFYDVNSLLTDRKCLEYILSAVPRDNVTYVGIATGGAIIASHFTPFAMIKDSELKGKIIGDYCLIDDVTTTEKSLREAIEIIGYPPKHIFLAVDRRKIKNLELTSAYTI